MEVAHIFIKGEINESLYKSIVAQYNVNNDCDEVKCFYDTPGGKVKWGRKIKEFLGSLNKPITAIADGKVMSIATEPFLASDKRLYTQAVGDKDIMIHNPWGDIRGDADKMEMGARMLREIEDEMSDNYASSTQLSKEEALSLMKEETFLSISKALEIGFIQGEYEQEFQAVAQLDLDNQNTEIMTNEQAVEINEKISGFTKLIKNLMAHFKPNALLVQDANGTEIDFPDLEDDATPSVGDKANVDGESASGEYLLPDGTTYVFTNGELSEIKEPADEPDEDMEALKEENQNVKQENETLQAENKQLKEDKETQEKKIKNFEAQANEMNEKFEALQDSLKGANLDLDDFQARGAGGNQSDGPKKRTLFKQKED
ncbi:ATP-dependent Clp protease proteolytic subunit [Ekhidna sp.]